MYWVTENFYIRVLFVGALVYMTLLLHYYLSSNQQFDIQALMKAITPQQQQQQQQQEQKKRHQQPLCLNEAKNQGSPIIPLDQPVTEEELLKRYGFLFTDTTSLRFALAGKEDEYTRAPLRYEAREADKIWEPITCDSNYSVALIIPFRDREEHLMIFLNHMHAFLRQQNVTYQIFVVEQVGTAKFNRGMLLNIGFIEASKLWQFDCYIMHDVDLLPEDTRNLYRCGTNPIHLTVATAVFNYRLPYSEYFGGGIAVTKKQYEDINGFSNVYFGWGAEDDDIYRRFVYKNYEIERYSPNIARYGCLKHGRDKHNPVNPDRNNLLNDVIKRIPHDGLKSLTYKLHYKRLVFGNLAYWFMVELTLKYLSDNCTGASIRLYKFTEHHIS